MRIKVAFLDDDSNYLNKVVSAMNERLSDRVEVSAFTDARYLSEYLRHNRNAVVLGKEGIHIDFSKLPSEVSFAYLVETYGVAECNGQKAICKYQKISDLYKGVLEVFSEKESNNYRLEGKKDIGNVIVFTSPKGGTGCTTAACAFALQKAREGKKVFYLNLEELGSVWMNFMADGKYTMSDVLFTVKSKKANVSMKLEMYLEVDKSGVNFFDSCRNPYDIFSMTEDNLKTIFEDYLFTKDYEYIVVDTNFVMRDSFKLLISRYAAKIICLSDGSTTANEKARKAIGVFQMMEKEEDCGILSKAQLLYNNMSNRPDCSIIDQPISTLGAINRFGGATQSQIIEEIAKEQLFENI